MDSTNELLKLWVLDSRLRGNDNLCANPVSSQFHDDVAQVIGGFVTPIGGVA